MLFPVIFKFSEKNISTHNHHVCKKCITVGIMWWVFDELKMNSSWGFIMISKKNESKHATIPLHSIHTRYFPSHFVWPAHIHLWHIQWENGTFVIRKSKMKGNFYEFYHHFLLPITSRLQLLGVSESTLLSEINLSLVCTH